ncbi:MAG: nucleotide-binding protein [Thermoplasmata archaeon]
MNCKTQMTGMGQVSFRTGGWTGGAGVLVGSWNAAAENLRSFSLYYCPQCGKFDLYYPGT